MDRIQELSARINERLKNSGSPTIAAAESCSGGGVASAITAWSGSSAYFLGSIVAYVNHAKANLLHVSEQTLDERGAVSAECSSQMAAGARAAFGADIGVSTTGIAGPTGGTERKPVGLVYASIATGQATRTVEHHFAGDRAQITRSAIEAALTLIDDELERMFQTSNTD